MNRLEEKRREAGIELAAADEVKTVYDIFGRAWGILRNFYLIDEHSEKAWEIVVAEVQEIGSMGKTKAEREIGIKIAIAVCECLEILSKSHEAEVAKGD